MIVRIETDFGSFVGHTARRLEKAPEAEPAQPAAGRRSRKPRIEIRAAGPSERFLEIDGKTSAIDRHPQSAAIGKFGDQVASPHAYPVETGLLGSNIDQPLDHVI